MRRNIIIAAALGALAIPAAASARPVHYCPNWFGASVIAASNNLSCGSAHVVLKVWDHQENPPFYAFGRSWNERHTLSDHYRLERTYIYSGPYAIWMTGPAYG